MIMSMQALLIIAPIVSMLVSCSSADERPPANRARDTGYQRVADTVSRSHRTIPTAYTLTDTTEWGNLLEEGRRALLRRRGVVIDTVDLGFGLANVGEDSLVFLPVRTDTVPLHTEPVPSYESWPTAHVLWTPLSRRELSDFLPLFDAYASSPQISPESVIYYWGISKQKPAKRLYAMRYEFRTGRLDSLFLNREDPLATDYRYYLGLPQIDGTKISFGDVILDDATWRIISSR